MHTTEPTLRRRVLLAVYLAAGIATYQGGAHAAFSAHVPWLIAGLYPVMLDGVAVAALMLIMARLGWHWTTLGALVIVLTAGTSGAAQAYVLGRHEHGGEQLLAWAIGATPAVVVLIATVLIAAPVSKVSTPDEQPADDAHEHQDEQPEQVLTEADEHDDEHDDEHLPEKPRVVQMSTRKPRTRKVAGAKNGLVDCPGGGRVSIATRTRHQKLLSNGEQCRCQLKREQVSTG